MMLVLPACSQDPADSAGHCRVAPRSDNIVTPQQALLQPRGLWARGVWPAETGTLSICAASQLEPPPPAWPPRAFSQLASSVAVRGNLLRTHFKERADKSGYSLLVLCASDPAAAESGGWGGRGAKCLFEWKGMFNVVFKRQLAKLLSCLQRQLILAWPGKNSRRHAGSGHWVSKPWNWLGYSKNNNQFCVAVGDTYFVLL